MKTLTTRLTLAITLLCALAAWAFQAATRPRTAAPASLAALVPQGALLTIESPDFARLLRQWSASPECTAWLKSDNYSVFSNSRLFSRLTDAQAEFNTVAFKGDPPDSTAFLNQIAGRQSIFAWYDVGNLEFLYITRLSAAQSARTALLQQRTHFQARQAGGQTFYLRTSASSNGTSRTVAFATVTGRPGGDLLLLATREDLVANALQLLAKSGASVDQEPWYTEATAALKPAPTAPPALHMVLNLDRIVPLAQFRTYWVQQNVSEMKQYRAAVSDLYLNGSSPQGNAFHEERALLPKTPAEASDPDLAPLAALAPPTAVFRATATQSPADAIAALEEKLLGRPHAAATLAEQAPDPTLTAAQQGDASDLDTRIDTPPPVSATFSNQALTETLKNASLDSVLTISTALKPTPDTSLWVPIHSAVVLHGTGTFNPDTLQKALQQSLRGTLTAGLLGIDFRPTTVQGHTLYVLAGPKPLYLAVNGPMALLSDDQPLLLQLLTPAASPTPTPATLIAGFDHTAQRPPYARLTSLIDGTNNAPTSETPATPATPAYFSRNLRSLSDAFAPLASERIVERHEGQIIHQTVTYQWQ